MMLTAHNKGREKERTGLPTFRRRDQCRHMQPHQRHRTSRGRLFERVSSAEKLVLFDSVEDLRRGQRCSQRDNVWLFVEKRGDGTRMTLVSESPPSSS